MTSPTHKEFSIVWACLAAIIIYTHGLSEINFYLALIVMIPLSSAGALFPDLDHSWENIKVKNSITWIINKILKITGAKHRSWQTHSLDIALVFCILSIQIPLLLQGNDIIDSFNREILSIIWFGFGIGWLSHLFSDMLTSGGVRLLCFYNKTYEFVPKKIFKFKFNTGGDWEEFVHNQIKKVNAIIILGCLAVPFML